MFISIIGLSKYWKEISCFDLQYSLFILPIKHEWLYDKRNKNNILNKYKIPQNKEFIKLIEYKYSQGLCIFMLDNINNDIINDDEYIMNGIFKCNLWNNHKISKTYQLISSKISSLHNLKTNKSYNKLKLDSYNWIGNNNILDEITYVNCKYKALKDIIQTTNIDLDVIISQFSYIYIYNFVCGYYMHISYKDSMHNYKHK